MKPDDARVDSQAAQWGIPSRAAPELSGWVSSRLFERAPSCEHDGLSEDFVRALLDGRAEPWARLRRAILQQELLRLLTNLESAGRTRPESLSALQSLLPELSRRLEKAGASPPDVRSVGQRLQEAMDGFRSQVTV